MLYTAWLTIDLHRLGIFTHTNLNPHLANRAIGIVALQISFLTLPRLPVAWLELLLWPLEPCRICFSPARTYRANPGNLFNNRNVMKSILCLTLGVLFRILQVYFYPSASEVVTALFNLLPVAIGRIINLNIQPPRLFWRRKSYVNIYAKERLMSYCHVKIISDL